MMVLVDFGYNLHLAGISEMKGYFTEKKLYSDLSNLYPSLSH